MFINMLQLILGYLESPVGQPLPTFPGKEFPATLARSQAQCPLSGGDGSPVHAVLCAIVGDSIATKVRSTLEIQSLLGFHMD